MDLDITLIVHNIRSLHNVGSMLRTSDGLGVNKVYFTGYTPFPISANDKRLPHIREKNNKQIRKTALGAEDYVRWEYQEDIFELINELKSKQYLIVALEQAHDSVNINNFNPPSKIALIIGREVEGIEEEVLAKVDKIVDIPMLGQKESFNVVQAMAMAVYKFRYFSK